MSTIVRLGRGGNRKEYIFKDGKFPSIQPTKNDFKLVGNFLEGKGQIVFDFAKTGYNIFVELEKLADSYFTLHSYTSTLWGWDYPKCNNPENKTFTQMMSSRVGKLMCIESNKYINFTTRYNSGDGNTAKARIKSIWVEKL